MFGQEIVVCVRIGEEAVVNASVDRNLVDEEGVLVLRGPPYESMTDLVDLLDLLEVANDFVTVSVPLVLIVHCLGIGACAIVQNEHHSAQDNASC